MRPAELPAGRLASSPRFDEGHIVRRDRRALGCDARCRVDRNRTRRHLHRTTAGCRCKRLRLADVDRDPGWSTLAIRLPPRHAHGTDTPAAHATAHACFVVRSNGQRTRRALFVLATNTWNAYNTWGGCSLYTGGTAVSFRRPFGRGMLSRPEVERDDRKSRPTRWGEEPDIDGVIFQTYRMARVPVGDRFDRVVHPRAPLRRVGRTVGARVRLRDLVRPRRPHDRRRLRPRRQRRSRRVLDVPTAQHRRGLCPRRRQLRQLLGQHDVLAGAARAECTPGGRLADTSEP